MLRSILVSSKSTQGGRLRNDLSVVLQLTEVTDLTELLLTIAGLGKDSNDLIIFCSIYRRVCQVSTIWTREVWICMFINWLPPHRAL